MLDTRPSEVFQFILGFRQESTEMSYDGFGRAPQAGDYSPELLELKPVDQKDVLPSFGVNLDFPNNIKVRYAYSETIARPTYRELQPFPMLNLSTNEVEVGNPGYMAQVSGVPGVKPIPVIASTGGEPIDELLGLSIADVQNNDLRVEWYPTSESFYALGFFKKIVGNPIERIQAYGQTSSLPVFTYVNNENTAEVTGLEFEWRQNLGELFNRRHMDFLSLGGNVTFIDAEVERSDAELSTAQIDGIPVSQASETRSLYDQPDFIANAYVNLNFESFGGEITLSANHTGDRLVGALNSNSSDIYEAAVTTLNLVYSQQVPWVDGLTIKFAAKNLNDPLYERVTKDGKNQLTTYDENGYPIGVVPLESYREGVRYSISASLAF